MARTPPTRSWKGTTTVAPSDSLVGDDPTPPAALSLLLAADDWPVQVGAGLYCSPAWATECNTVAAGLSVRRVAVVVPLACLYGRMWVTRCGNNDALTTPQQAQHSHASTTGGGMAGNPVSVADSPVSGVEVYLQTHATLAMTANSITGTGTTINDAPTAPIDRALLVPEGLSAAVEVYELQNVAGASLQFFAQTSDLESL